MFGDPRLPERFWAKVQVDPATGCFLWTSALNERGYAYVWVTEIAASRRAHRWAYEQLHGLLARDVELDHLCKVRHCVNVDHLEPVDHVTNMRRSVEGRTHFRCGHEMTPENTGRCGAFTRCRPCTNANAALRRQAAR